MTEKVQQISNVESGGVVPHCLHYFSVEAGAAGLLACTAAGQYPCTQPSLSLALRHGLRLLPPSEEVPVCFGRPLSPSG